MRGPGLLAAAALLGLASAAWAQEPAGSRGCVKVEVDGHRSADLNCLNQQLAQVVEDTDQRKAALDAVVAGALPASAAGQGLYTQAATRERLGSSFGHSVIPQRPPAFYSNPLVRH